MNDHTNISFEEMKKNASEATILLKSMANETRLLILCQLFGGEKSVASLMENVHLSQSALSQHLAILRRERLVNSRRDAQSVYYSLASDEVVAIIRTLDKIFCHSC
jgi:ArsR family transcriptional regulator, virulence genes transcriptional regulator